MSKPKPSPRPQTLTKDQRVMRAIPTHWVDSTNSIESVFAVLKRGIIGVYHSTSKKHLGRYVDEFTFRLNDGNVKYPTLERLDSFVSATAGKRLTYKGLIQ